VSDNVGVGIKDDEGLSSLERLMECVNDTVMDCIEVKELLDVSLRDSVGERVGDSVCESVSKIESLTVSTFVGDLVMVTSSVNVFVSVFVAGSVVEMDRDNVAAYVGDRETVIVSAFVGDTLGDAVWERMIELVQDLLDESLPELDPEVDAVSEGASDKDSVLVRTDVGLRVNVSECDGVRINDELMVRSSEGVRDNDLLLVKGSDAVALTDCDLDALTVRIDVKLNVGERVWDILIVCDRSSENVSVTLVSEVNEDDAVRDAESDTEELRESDIVEMSDGENESVTSNDSDSDRLIDSVGSPDSERV